MPLVENWLEILGFRVFVECLGAFFSHVFLLQIGNCKMQIAN